MNPIYTIPFFICILSSCTLSSTQSSSSIDIPKIQVSGEQPENISQEILIHAYQEELLAHDIYIYIAQKYPTLIEVNNIIKSENEHREQVGTLLESRGIARPSDYGIYVDTYTTLKNMIDTSLTGAIETGIMVETGDINNLFEEYQKITDTDIRQVFENIGGGSYNHLRAFLRMAQDAQYTAKIDTTAYLTTADVSQNGSLKYKMTELLKSNGLPTSGVSQPGNPRSHGNHGKNH